MFNFLRFVLFCALVLVSVQGQSGSGDHDDVVFEPEISSVRGDLVINPGLDNDILLKVDEHMISARELLALAAEVPQLRSDLADLRIEFESFKKESMGSDSALQASIDDITDNVVPGLDSTIGTLQSELTNVQSSVTDVQTLLSNTKMELRAEMGYMNATTESIATQLSTAENGIDNNELELVTLGDTLTGLTNDVVANDGEIENLKAAVAAVDVEVTESSQQLDSELTDLSARVKQIEDCGSTGGVHDGNQCQVIKVPTCPALNNPTNGVSSHIGIGFPGFEATFSCNAEHYLAGNNKLTCKQDETWSSSPPTCNACPSNCQVCPNGGCTTCKSGFTKFNGNCVTPFYSCKEGADKGAIPRTTGTYNLFKKGSTTQLIQAQCYVSGSAFYTAIGCDKISGGGCITSRRSTDHNTCKTVGYHMSPARDQGHWRFLYDKFGTSYMGAGMGVYKTSNGGSYTNCAMRRPGGCNDWRTFDGGNWYLRDGNFGEPNGDYEGNCWLSLYSQERDRTGFNDLNCNYVTDRYICTTSDH